MRLPFRPVQLVVIACWITLSSCGNVIDPGGGGTGVRPATSIGPISGFGSIIVNGVRYENGNAVISDDEGRTLVAGDLRLGMTVEVRGSADPAARTGNADAVLVFSELNGQVEALNAGGIVVNGVQVNRQPTTVIDNGSAVNVGDFVEVFGAFDPVANTVSASRIEIKTSPEFKLRGVAAAWNPNAETFRVGPNQVSYAGLTLPTDFRNGVQIRVRTSIAPVQRAWIAESVRIVSRRSGDDGDYFELEGVVTSVDGSQLLIEGITVDVSGATVSGGSLSDLLVGRRVEVEGEFLGGVLRAAEIEFEDAPDSDDSFEVTGRVSNLAGNQFTVQSVTVDAGQSPRFREGSAADLADGVCVEVSGNLSSGMQGSVLQASEIEFEEECD